jgi:hypothetical protein
MQPESAERIAGGLCNNAVVNLCGCGTGMNTAELQIFSNLLSATVCGCDDLVNMACNCQGEWICRSPNTEIPEDVLEERARREQENLPDKYKTKR